MIFGGFIVCFVIDEWYKGKGFGEWLFIDVFWKLLVVSDSVVFLVIIVDVKDGVK